MNKENMDNQSYLNNYLIKYLIKYYNIKTFVSLILPLAVNDSVIFPTGESKYNINTINIYLTKFMIITMFYGSLLTIIVNRINIKHGILCECIFGDILLLTALALILINIFNLFIGIQL